MATTISPTPTTRSDIADGTTFVSDERDRAKYKRITTRHPGTNAKAERSITSLAHRIGAALAVAAMLSGS